MTEMIVLQNTQRVQQTLNLTHRAGSKRQLFERVGEKHGSKTQVRVSVPGSLTILAGGKSEPVPAFWQHLPEIANAIKAKRLTVAPAPAVESVVAPEAPTEAPTPEVSDRSDTFPEPETRSARRRG